MRPRSSNSNRHRSRWPVWAAVALLALAVGAASSWCVAAYFAARGYGRSISHEETPWPHVVPADWPAKAEMMEEIRGRGLWAEWYTAFGPEIADDQTEPSTYRLLAMRTGWPFAAFQYESTLFAEHQLAFLVPMDEAPSMWVGGFACPEPWLREEEAMSDAPRDRRIPIRPCWLGFAANTTLTAGVLLGVAYGAGAVAGGVRRRIRHRRGCCPTCGYDRAGVAGPAVCPECGADA